MLIAACILFCAHGCVSSVTPHENFNAHMQNNVGRRIDDPETNWVKPRAFVVRRDLPNGNFENEYSFRGTCRYFFEYDPPTRKIVAWRFEGSEQDCAIVP